MADVLPKPKPVETKTTILRAAGVRKVFRMGDSELVILKHLDLTVRRGEFLAIEGRSGSGKSTLMHILGGLDAADSGTVEFEGQDINALAITATPPRWNGNDPIFRLLRQHIWVLLGYFYLPSNIRRHRADRKLSAIRNSQFGFVFQFYYLLPEMNVLENVMLPLMVQHSWLGYLSKRAELCDRASHLLEQVGLAHRLRHRPNQLSGGERQRVAIARALMNQPKVLFADEPTGNLDTETGRQIMDVLEKLHQETGQTILMVTHDRALAREADRVLLLKDGKLVPEEKAGQGKA